MSPSLPPVAEVAADLRATKALGQNFLLDQGLCDQIAHGLMTTADVLEIGPGPGGLTRALLSQGKIVTAVDFDQRMINALSPLQKAYPAQLTLRQDNALKIPLQTFTPVSVVGNLPFNISTELLLRWLPQSEHIAEMLLMFQTEVAERIMAAPNNKSYGRLSVLAQYLMDIHIHLAVPARAFMPAPKVDATVVYFSPKANITERLLRYPTLDQVVKMCFSARRKTLARALKGKIPEHLALLEQAEIPATSRAESLDLADFQRLTEIIIERDGTI